MPKWLQILLGLACLTVVIAGGAEGWNWWQARQRKLRIEAFEQDMNLYNYLCHEREKAYLKTGKLFEFDPIDTRIGNQIVVKYGVFSDGKWLSPAKCDNGEQYEFLPPAPTDSKSSINP